MATDMVELERDLAASSLMVCVGASLSYTGPRGNAICDAQVPVSIEIMGDAILARSTAVYLSGVEPDTAVQLHIVDEPLVFGVIPATALPLIFTLLTLVLLLVVGRLPQRVAGLIERLVEGGFEKKEQ